MKSWAGPVNEATKTQGEGTKSGTEWNGMKQNGTINNFTHNKALALITIRCTQENSA